jgi:GNAT superfamily N-acetyltransferase
MAARKKVSGIRFYPLAPERWADFEKLFGPRGACAGCWCMWFRRRHADFEKNKGAGNRRAMQTVVRKGDEPGILAYAGGEPVGWCAAAPRERYVRLGRSRILKPVDDQPVWSVVCFFVHKEWRGKGIQTRLLEAVKKFAGDRGCRTLEGYPSEPKKGRMPEAFAYHGLASAFQRAGFKECARRSETRPIMRCALRGGKKRLAAPKRVGKKKSAPKPPAGASRKKAKGGAATRAGAPGATAARAGSAESKVLCRTPTPGKQGVRIQKWKFDIIRKAILKVVPRNRKGVPFKDLSGLVAENIPVARGAELGSVTWYTVCVKLELEVRGEIERVPGPGPQRVRRT